MTAPPRPEWLWQGIEADETPWGFFASRGARELADYITYLERELESCEAALDRMRERPDPDSMWGNP